MRHLIFTGLIILFSANLLHGQAKSSLNGLEVENHEVLLVVIEEMVQGSVDIALTRSRIESRVSVRLHQVHLRPTFEITPSAFLHIKVTVVENSYSINLSFDRQAFFSKNGEIYSTLAKVYAINSLGIHGGDSEFVMSGLDRLLDRFISDYLEAND